MLCYHFRFTLPSHFLAPTFPLALVYAGMYGCAGLHTQLYTHADAHTYARTHGPGHGAGELVHGLRSLKEAAVPRYYEL